MLPEGCVAIILSFTSPADALSSSLVSSVFRSAAESDLVWDRFLPADYREIVSKSINCLHFQSRKELYRRLCEPIFIDGGRKIFRIEKFSGKKCYVLSARALSITWGNVPMYWTWKPEAESRFSEVAELRTTDWLEVVGVMRTPMLSPNTKYEAYMIVKIRGNAFGLDLIPAEVSVKVGDKQVDVNTAYLCGLDGRRKDMERLVYANRTVAMSSRAAEGDRREPEERADGWLEIKIGEFMSGGGDEVVTMSLREVKGYQLKGGLMVQGLEIRPKNHE